MKHFDTSDEKLKMKGDFHFEVVPLRLSDKLVALRTVTFSWDVESSQNSIAKFGEDSTIEVFAETLKQDFIKFIKKQ